MKKHVLIFILIPFLFLNGLTVGAVKKEERKWQDETMYFLMVDRFSNGDTSNDLDSNVQDPKAYQGGDFKGITEKLDYIKEMGFTSIWLTPIFDNEDKGYHGYWIKDFYKPDEHFGTMEEFKELVKEAHKRDIKVVLDFVINHVGPNHEWVKDPAKKDWFHEKKDISNWDNQKQVEDGWLFGLPDLNTENPEVKKYLFDAAKWWIEETDIDGYRLDTVKHVPVDVWAEFSAEVKKTKQDFYLIGEVWHDDPRYIAKYDRDAGIDGFVDYPLNKELRKSFVKPDQSLGLLFNVWKRNQIIYEEPYLMGNFLDNHDNVRFTRDIIQNKVHPGPRWKLALTYLYTTPGIPIVYYGSEIAMDGGKDPDNRRLMNFKADKELITYISKLGELRGKYPSLTRGSFELLYEKEGMAVYKREYKKEIAVIAINNTKKSQQVTIKEKDLEANKELRGLLGDDLVRSKDGQYDIIIDREKAEIYFIAEKTGLNIPYLAVMGAVYAAFIGFIVLIWKRKRKKHTD